LVVEIPTDERTLERVIGAAPASYAQIAAVAWVEGPDAAKSAVRIVVNNTLADRLTGDGIAVLLTHEATHVATRSADSPAPMWLVEGFADFVAYRAVPSSAAAAAAALLADVRAHGVPRTLPPNSRFRPDAADLPLTYAQAWLACRFVAEKYSLVQLNRLYAAADAGKPSDDAMRTVLGISLAEFTRRWQAYLRHQAGT
jgi:hypothetical protein